MNNIEYYSISPITSRIKTVPYRILCEPAPQLVDDSEEHSFDPLRLIMIRNCSLKGRDLVPFKNYFSPFWRLWPQYRKSTLLNEIRQLLSLASRCSLELKTIQGISCSLASHPSWESNIFHWFLDILPRVFAAEHIAHSLDKVSLLKPGYLLDWQQESLRILGYDISSIVVLPDSSSLSVTTEYFISLLNSRSQHDKGLSFHTHPFIVKTLKKRFSLINNSDPRHVAKRLFILRDSHIGRSFLNLNEIKTFADLNNFTLIDLSCLSLSAQIQLFQSATHVVGAHGAGLIHLIHCTNACIMEIHCSRHGIRSDYFQIAAINKLRYFYHVCPPANVNNDMVLDIKVLLHFMRSTRD